MLRPSRVLCSRLWVATLIFTAGCLGDLDQDPVPLVPGQEGGPTEAQFDPTNPIPVLTLIPVPTVLAENPDGTLNTAAVTPDACESPTAAQCLALLDGWPTDFDITLFFSSEIDLDTVSDGIELFALSADGVMTPVSLDGATVTQVARAVPTPDLAAAGVAPGTDEARALQDECNDTYGYEDDEVTPGFDVLITPNPALDFSTRYIVLVKSTDEDGLRDVNGDVIQPSGLYFLLNTDEVPVQQDGTITSALLRSQVQGSVLAASFDGRLLEDLTPTERVQLDAAVQQSGLQLRPLYDVFNSITTAALANGVIADRSELVFANLWTTTRPTPSVVFDPLTGAVPFPNTELLTAPDGQGGRRVNIPVVEGSPIPAELLPGLNKLDGFSLRNPGVAGVLPETGPIMLFSVEAPVDLATLDGSVVMYRLDAQGQPQASVALTVTSTNGVDIIVQPQQPLDPATSYVVGVTDQMRQENGQPYSENTTFGILKTPFPLVDATGTATTAVVAALQCAPLTAGGDSLATPDVVNATAQSLEGLRQLWQPVFTALETQGIARTNVLLGWTYTTQSLINDVDAVKENLFSGEFDNASPRVTPTGTRFVGTASIAEAVGVVDTLCLAACLQGALPTVPAANCVDGQGNATPAVAADPVCQLTIGLTAGGLGTAELFFMRTHRVQAGNPFFDGTFDFARFDAPADGLAPIWVVTPSTPPPPTGYPVAVFQHGLGGSKEDGFLIANTLAAAGRATVLMDLPWHGDRASDLTTVMDSPLGPTEVQCVPPVDPEMVVCDPVTRMCTGGCDGIQDASGTGFLSANTSGIRDNFRQSSIDQLTLLYTLQQEGTAGGLLPMLDGSQIGYVGQSLGGLTGANLVGYIEDQELDSAVLNVAGGDLINLLLNSVLGPPLFLALNQAGVCDFNVPDDPTSGCQITEDFLAFLALADWTLQAGDPLQLADAATSRFGVDNILMQVSMPDPVIPNVASEALGAAYGFATDNTSGGYQVYDFSMLPQATMGFGCHGFLLAPVCGACFLDTLCMTFGAQQQAATFIATEGEIVGNRVPDSIAGMSCANPCGN